MTAVLIVDDEPRIRTLLRRWLADAYETSEAPDAETAVGMMGRSVPDVVFCDVQMPGHGGLWLVEQVAELFPHVGIVLATAAHFDPPPATAAGGVIEYLSKPFESAEVLAAVGRAVQRRQAALRPALEKQRQ